MTGVADPPEGSGTPDRCPGALRLHQAVDGALVRVRLPGGQVTVDQVRALAATAVADGAGTLELTSHGNVQIRGIPDAAAAGRIADRLGQAGLVPSATHERVRNVLASPLSGRDSTSATDVRGLVREFDAALMSAADLAALSGRFLFAFDDGRGDVAALGADVCWIADSTGVSGTLLLTAADHGLRVATAEAPATLIHAARAFLRVRAGATHVWRIDDLPGASAQIAVSLGGRATGAPMPLSALSGGPAPGPHANGFVVVGAPMGRLTAGQADLVADLAEGPELVITPWRAIVLDAATDAAAELAAAGLVVDATSPWHGLTACAGREGCASALADVRADAAATVAAEPATRQLPVHWVGCDRCCGRPAYPAAMVVATRAGYRVLGTEGEVMGGSVIDRLALATGAAR